jgi:hypothetical protein
MSLVPLIMSSFQRIWGMLAVHPIMVFAFGVASEFGLICAVLFISCTFQRIEAILGSIPLCTLHFEWG